MNKRALGQTGFEITPLVFGGNVFGWTLDQKASFEILDAFVDLGFDAIDTADVYSSWVSGNQGGESETIIGNWLKARPGMRDRIKLFTKVGSDMGVPGHKGLSEKWILQGVEDSLRRLQTDCIDLYFSHWPDASVGHAETLGAYDKLLKAGKIRSIGASNYDARMLAQSLKVSREQGLPAYQVLQPEYNLYDRGSFDGALSELCLTENIGVVTYFSLASGFLSGKYRTKADMEGAARSQMVDKYLNERGLAILAALDEVSGRYQATPAEVALAWLLSREAVTAPIASATRPAHLESFARALRLKLDEADLEILERASAPA